MPDPLELFGYPVLGRIGVGAASVIYKVREPRSTRIHALKHVVRHGDKDQRFLDQVVSEHEIGVQLDHRCIRHIGKLLKKRRLFKVTEIGLLMEHIDAPSLDSMSRIRPLDTVRIFVQIAEAVSSMHAKGFVHADLKPTNVLVARNMVKVIDLGQACPIGTRKQRIQGTPGYIAPEQAHRRRITERTDVYNFGATLYWTMTREVVPTALPPGSMDGPARGPIDPARIPAPTPMKDLVDGVPAGLDDLVAQCVQVSRGDRPSGMEPIIAALRGIEAELTRGS